LNFPANIAEVSLNAGKVMSEKPLGTGLDKEPIAPENVMKPIEDTHLQLLV
jgi:hypothetical protein